MIGRIKEDIFAENPRWEFLNSDRLEDDNSTTWALQCIVWHSVCFFSFHNEEAVNLSSCIRNKITICHFHWFWFPSPTGTKEA